MVAEKNAPVPLAGREHGWRRKAGDPEARPWT